MRWLGNVLSRMCLVISAAMALGVPVGYAALPLLPVCSWPVESTGQGILNVATQDTNTTYWFMPIDTSRWKSVVIQGIYPNARFFNFATYDQRGLLTDTLFDSDIVPDSGGSNPFTMAATGSRSANASYTVNIGASNGGSPNFLSVGGNRLAFLVYRVIVPDKGLDRSGGVGVPAVTLVAQNGSMRRLRPCPFAGAESSLGNMIPVLIASGFTEAAGFLQGILSAANQQTSIAGSCIASSPGRQVAVSFGPAPGTDFFPNPPTAYLQTPNVCFQPNKIVVVRGRALVYPNTYLGGSVLEPVFDGQVQVRYWSMCNNDGVFRILLSAAKVTFKRSSTNPNSTHTLYRMIQLLQTGSPRTGPRPVRQARRLQYRSGRAIHQRRVHQYAAGSPDRDQHGRTRALPRQHLRRALVVDREARGAGAPGRREAPVEAEGD